LQVQYEVLEEYPGTTSAGGLRRVLAA